MRCDQPRSRPIVLCPRSFLRQRRNGWRCRQAVPRRQRGRHYRARTVVDARLRVSTRDGERLATLLAAMGNPKISLSHVRRYDALLGGTGTRSCTFALDHPQLPSPHPPAAAAHCRGPVSPDVPAEPPTVRRRMARRWSRRGVRHVKTDPLSARGFHVPQGCQSSAAVDSRVGSGRGQAAGHRTTTLNRGQPRMVKAAGQRRFEGIIAGQRTTPIMLCKQGVVGSSPIVSTHRDTDAAIRTTSNASLLRRFRWEPPKPRSSQRSALADRGGRW